MFKCVGQEEKRGIHFQELCFKIRALVLSHIEKNIKSVVKLRAKIG